MDVIELYGDAWNVADVDERRRLLDASLTEDCELLEPRGRFAGREEILARLNGFTDRFPGARVDIATKVDEHNGVARYGWMIFDRSGHARSTASTSPSGAGQVRSSGRRQGGVRRASVRLQPAPWVRACTCRRNRPKRSSTAFGRGDSHLDVFAALGVHGSSRPTAHGCVSRSGGASCPPSSTSCAALRRTDPGMATS